MSLALIPFRFISFFVFGFTLGSVRVRVRLPPGASNMLRVIIVMVRVWVRVRVRTPSSDSSLVGELFSYVGR